jgi:opacity protein-like surface antigen
MPKGVRFEGEYDASAEGMGKVDFKADLIANEVSVPVLLKFRLLPGTTPYVLAGGEVGYILSSSMDWSYTSGDQTEKGKEDLLKKDENGEVYINQLDYGAVFGGGFEVRLAGLTLSVEGRYHLGQANLLKQTKAGEGGGQKDEDYIRSKALVVMAGIKF